MIKEIHGIYRSPDDPPAGGPPAPVTPPAPTAPPAKTYSEAEFKEASDRAKTLEAENKTFRDSQLSDTQKLEQRAKEAEEKFTAHETALREERLGRAIEREATALKIVDTDAALKLLDHSQIKFVDGKPSNIKDLLTQLTKDKPYLIASTSSTSPANPAITGRGGQTVNDQIDTAFNNRRRGGGFRI